MAAGVDLRRFYEAFPYQCADTELASLIEGRRAVIGDPARWFHMYFPDQPYREDLDVLVAGCRDTEPVCLAAGARQARFCVIDDDREALHAVERLKRRHQLDNLELLEAPVEQAASLGRDFDLIFWSDSPQYAESPAVILSALRGVLRPGGSLNVTLAARYGRLVVAMLQELLQRVGAGADRTGLEKGRQWIQALPVGHPFRAIAPNVADLNYDRGLAELLLQNGHRVYSVPEMYALLDEAELRFQRFLCQAHYMPQCSLLASQPEILSEVRARRLEEQFAITELFRGNRRSHSFVACRRDRPAGSYHVDFSGQAWLGYVPIRNPGVGADLAKLPAGAVARLRWEAHEHPEICALLTENQARLFDAVDDQRSTAEIIESCGLAGEAEQVQAFARNFFESMWSFDYVWFQTAPPRSPGPASTDSKGG